MKYVYLLLGALLPVKLEINGRRNKTYTLSVSSHSSLPEDAFSQAKLSSEEESIISFLFIYFETNIAFAKCIEIALSRPQVSQYNLYKLHNRTIT